MSTYRLSLLSSFAIVLTGCTTLAPEYVKPSAPVAETWPIAQSGDPDSQPIDELGWSEFYGDERLRQLIELALNNNRSLRQDALAVESARAQFLIARANTIPSVDGSISSSTLRTNGDTSYTNSVSAGISAFELDVFGRLNNLRDSELETYLSFEETLRSMQITLVAEVATAYFTLAADQQRLQLAQETLDSQQRSLELTQKTFEIGTASGLDVATAQTSVDIARADIATFRTQVAQDINNLTLIVGQRIDPDLLVNPDSNIYGPIAPLIHTVGPVVEAPSELLQRRPDVLAAERTLRARYADIGAARASRFPSITLTSSVGTSSSQLSDLLGSGSGLWSFIPAVSVPIFNSGALKAVSYTHLTLPTKA